MSKLPEAERTRRLELEKRLRREGRWDKAKRFKLAVQGACKAKNQVGPAMVQHTWDEMEKAFDPLTPAEIRRLEEKEKSKPEDPVRVKIPRTWDRLPDRATLEEEVHWVHQNLVLCLEEYPNGKNRMNLQNARTPAPSLGALDTMLGAVANPHRFRFDTVPKVLGKLEEGADGEVVKKERKSIAEIQEILDRMEETTDA